MNASFCAQIQFYFVTVKVHFLNLVLYDIHIMVAY